MSVKYSPDYIDPENYLTLVKSVAGRMTLKPSAVFDHDDAVGAGAESLWKAIGSYQQGRGVSVVTYAYQRIRWGILTEYRRQFPYAHGRYDPERDKPVECLALGEAVMAQEGELMLEETIPDTSLPDVDAVLDIRDAVKLLTRREQEVVRGVFWDGKDRSEIASDLGISGSRVGKCLQVAIAKLRYILDGGIPLTQGESTRRYICGEPMRVY